MSQCGSSIVALGGGSHGHPLNYGLVVFMAVVFVALAIAGRIRSRNGGGSDDSDSDSEASTSADLAGLPQAPDSPDAE